MNERRNIDGKELTDLSDDELTRAEKMLNIAKIQQDLQLDRERYEQERQRYAIERQQERERYEKERQQERERYEREQARLEQEREQFQRRTETEINKMRIESEKIAKEAKLYPYLHLLTILLTGVIAAMIGKFA